MSLASFWQSSKKLHFFMSIVESQKGVTDVQRCSVENQKGVTDVKDVPLRPRRALSLYKSYGVSAFLVLNGTFLHSINTLLALN